jgi:hypothetical protein
LPSRLLRSSMPVPGLVSFEFSFRPRIFRLCRVMPAPYLQRPCQTACRSAASVCAAPFGLALARFRGPSRGSHEN